MRESRCLRVDRDEVTLSGRRRSRLRARLPPHRRCSSTQKTTDEAVAVFLPLTEWLVALSVCVIHVPTVGGTACSRGDVVACSAFGSGPCKCAGIS